MTATLPVAEQWFERRSMDDGVTLLWEPHVVPLMQCNIWHVAGRDRDLVIDTGMGIGNLVEAMADLVDRADKPMTAVATHGHGDHIGGHHEFSGPSNGGAARHEIVAHAAEAEDLEAPILNSLDPIEAWGQEGVDEIRRAGYEFDDPLFVTALPAGYRLDSFAQKPAKVTRLVDEGDVIDTGDRRFEVLHLPGHSPGSIGLWEAETGTLFSGDAVYDGPLLDGLDHSDIDDYCETMRRLLDLPVSVVHGGHDPSFDRDRLQAIAREYLARRG